jgi:hypothetical protein
MPVKVVYLIVITRADLADTALSHHCVANPESAAGCAAAGSNVVPLLVLGPGSGDNVGPLLLLVRQLRNDVAIRPGVPAATQGRRCCPGGRRVAIVLLGKIRRRLHVGHMTS